MNKEECSELVAHVYGAWGKESPLMAELKTVKRVWWTFVHDLDLSACMTVVNALALYESYIPRPGEIRRRVIMGNVPDGLEAWEEWQNARHAANHGGMPNKLSPLTKKTVEKMGETAAGLHTNGDRGNFLSLYQKTVNEEVESACQVIQAPK